MLSRLNIDDPEVISRCLRDVVALATLPSMWSGAAPLRIAESLAASLFTTLNPEFVYVAVDDGDGRPPVTVAQTGRYEVDAALAAEHGPQILQWAREHDPDDVLRLSDSLGRGPVRVATRAIGHYAELGVIAAAFSGDDEPTPVHQLLLNIAATQATTAIQNAHLLRSLRDGEDYLRAAIDSAAGGFCGIDRDGITTICNSGFLRMLGFDRTEAAVGVRLHDLIRRTRADGSAYRVEDCPIHRAARTGQPAHVDDERFFRLDGSSFPVEYWTLPIVRDGEVRGAVTTFIDITARKEAEHALSETRSRLEAALTAGEIGTFVWDVVADRLYGDRNFAVLFGIPLGSDGAAPLAEFVTALHPDDREPTLALVRRTMETGCDYRAEYRIMIGGRERWVIARGKVERDATGRVVRFPGVLLDITERKLAEQARAEIAHRYERQTRLFEGVASTTPDFIYVFDRGGRFLYANRRLLEVWGRKLDEVVGKTCIELGYEQWHHDMHMREIAQVIQTKRPIVGEVPFKAERTGIFGVYEYIFTPVIGPDGEVEVIAGTTRDVTERKRSEEAQRESAERLKAALDAARTGTFRWDFRTDALSWDQNLDRLFGLPPGETVGSLEKFIELVHPDDRAGVIAHCARCATEGADFDMEFRVVWPDGTLHWLDDKGKAFLDEHGKPLYMTGACVDITERKRAEEERLALLDAERSARAEAEHASRLKDEFLATLGHELRTPLNAILGWSQLLRHRTKAEGEVGQGLSVIERNARNQAQLIEDLLDMSRIMSGKLRIEVQRVDLGTIIAAAIESVMPAAEAKEIRIQKVLDTHVGPVRGDAARLQQVVWNLLANAIKFTPRGGVVRVALERVNSHVEITVTDTGIGIEPEFLPHVFDRFRQADGATTRQHGGLGIGLSIVKQLVEMHGGTVRAKSPGAGRGATFSVELPLMPVHDDGVSPAGQQHPRRAASAEEVSDFDYGDRMLEGVSVLVVDDDRDARELIRRVLEECRAQVMLAGDAKEALELLRRERPNVLVSDIGMPGEDGYSLIRRVRELPAEEGGDVPAAALTAFARSEDRRRALLAGFQTHIAKPVEPSELVTVVASLAGKIRKPG